MHSANALVVHVEARLVPRADEQALPDPEAIRQPVEVDIPSEEEPAVGRDRVFTPRCDLRKTTRKMWAKQASVSAQRVLLQRRLRVGLLGRLPDLEQARRHHHVCARRRERARGLSGWRRAAATDMAIAARGSRAAAARRTVLLLEAALREELLRGALLPVREDRVVRAPVGHPDGPAEELREAPALPLVVLRVQDRQRGWRDVNMSLTVSEREQGGEQAGRRSDSELMGPRRAGGARKRIHPSPGRRKKCGLRRRSDPKKARQPARTAPRAPRARRRARRWT